MPSPFLFGLLIFFFDLFHFADAFPYDDTAADVMIFESGFLVGGEILKEDLYRRVTLFLRALGDRGTDVAVLDFCADLIGVIVTYD